MIISTIAATGIISVRHYTASELMLVAGFLYHVRILPQGIFLCGFFHFLGQHPFRIRHHTNTQLCKLFVGIVSLIFADALDKAGGFFTDKAFQIL